MIYPNKVIRSKRKYITLIIDNNGELIVRAPLKCSDRAIFDFVESKQNWIIKHLSTARTEYRKLEIKTGEKISLIGREFTIILQDRATVKVVDNEILIPYINSKEKLIAYIKKIAKSYLNKRVADIANAFGFVYGQIKISSAHTNWGSCSYKNYINFTYKLMLCPPAVIDYIIVHELCHTKIKNHSKAFYKLVESVMPNYKQCIKWLRDNKGIIEYI